jgi:hypothetical protein
VSSRVAKYGVAAADDPLRAKASPPPAPAAAPAGSAERPWNRFQDENRTHEAVNARQAMAAAKVLAPLVAAVSLSPGSSASSKERSSALRDMLVAVHRGSTEIAEAWSARFGKDVPRWTVTQFMQGMANVIASRWERRGKVDVDPFREAMVGVLNSDDPAIRDLIVEAADHAYVEVSDKDIATSRVAVSAVNAGWALFDWVCHEKLSLDPEGRFPGRCYTYDKEPSEIVSRMLAQCVSECRGLTLRVDSADLRVAHLQASIGRMAALMGAEYVTQTRAVMNWIFDSTLTEAQYQERKAAAPAQFEDRILPHVFEWARVHFLRIENGAFNAIEELNEKSKNGDGGAGSTARPAGH